jgi:hypothetical protein
MRTSKAVVKFTRDHTTSALITRCAKRAVALYDRRGVPGDRIKIEMDLSATNANGCPMDFNKLLSFDDGNFLHDITGIRNNISRTSGRMTGHFVPRSARGAQL